jgi:HTH-type transcriptional regulator, glycine betaine synthesis regulator
MTVTDIGYGEDSDPGIEGTGGGSLAGLGARTNILTSVLPGTAPGREEELRLESIDYFVSFVQMFGLPKSIGQIYGLLFASLDSLAMDEIVTQLGISKGSASQGLSLLKSLGAVTSHQIPSDRREHFRADLNVSRIVTHFFENRLNPRLLNGEERLKSMVKLARSIERERHGERGAPDGASVLHRFQALQKWQKRGRSIIPFLLKWLKR